MHRRKSSLYTCRNGLTDAAAPIIVEGEHIANFFVGQFVTEPPDVSYFRAQAKRFGFDEVAYLQALANVPIVQPERLGPILEFLASFAQMLGTMGLDKMRQLEVTEQLRKSSEKLQMALDGSNLGTWDWNLKTGNCLWSERAVGFLGYTASDIKHDYSTWESLVHPEDLPHVLEVLKEHMRAEIPSSEVQYRMKSTAGEWRWVASRGKVVERDEDGSPLRMAGTILDITERKRTEEALAESEQRFRSTFEQAAVGLCHVAPGGKFLRVNKKLCDLLGYTSHELLGCSFQEITYPDDLEADLENVRQVLADEIKTYSMEKRYIRKDGSHFWADLTVSLTRDPSGAPRYFISVVEDITDRKNAEDAMRLSEQRYRAMFANMKSGVAVYEPIGNGEDFVFKDFNSAAEHISKVSKDDVVGKRLLEMFPHMDRFGLLGALQRVYSSGQPEHLPAGLYRDRVREGWRENFLYKLPSGEVVAMYDDVTDRKKAEEELRDSERRFRMIYELAPVMIHSIDRDAVIRNVNKKWLQELGYERKEVLGQRIECVLTPDSQIRLYETLPQFWRNGHVSDVSYQYIRKDGTIIDVLLDSIVVTDMEWGSVSLSVTRNVTEQKRAEEALRQSESTLRSLLQAAPIGIGQVSADLTLCWTNHLLCKMLGYSREDLDGRSSSILYEDEEQYLRMDRIKRSERGTHGIGPVGTRFKRKDGSCVDVLVSSSFIVPGDSSYGFVFTVMDMTERRRLEEQLLRSQKMEAVGTLAGGIAHDFNNLLQVIQGYADLALLDLPDDQRPHSALREIRAAARSAAELTQGLLTFSRRVESSLRIVDLNRVVEHSAHLLRRTIPKMIDIELRLAEVLRPIMADPTQLQQVVMNLAVNSRDAMNDAGRLVIHTENVHLDAEYCRTHVGIAPGEYVLLAVSDTGCGMPKEMVDRVFEPFFTTKEVGKGTGLGLALVYGIVQNHGGCVMCYSEPGHGTTFKIFLPVADQADKGDEPAEIRQALVGGSETILLIDDEAPVREFGAQILTRFGYTVLTASDGKRGLDVFRRDKERIDLIILDLIMPGMSGRECLTDIMKTDPSTKVLIASGYATNGQIDASLDEGASASIRKPYEARQLLEEVRRVLDDL